MPVPSNWFEDFFHGITLDLWRKAIPIQQTKAEADFLIKVLNCLPGAHVLDVPSGNGRLSFELAKRGYLVTGVDLSQEFVDEARQAASVSADAEDADGHANFILGDMRNIEGESIYEGAYCFGNSFGFMPHADMEKFLAG